MLEVEDIVKAYKDNLVLNRTSLTVEKGEIRVVIGLNGCGKSTLLKIITGIVPCEMGSVRINGRDVTALLPEERSVGYVPQSTALFNHLTIEQNITYSKKNGRGSDAAFSQTIKLLNLGMYLGKKPKELSGGFRARVALARALFSEPAIMLLDEPLTEVDHAKKEQMLPEFKQVLHELHIPVLYITHDPREADLIGDRVSIMDKGKLKNIASTDDAFRIIREMVREEA